MDCFSRWATIGCLALGLFAIRPARAADPLPAAKLPGESLATARRLAEARGRADKQQWGEAVEEYQRILDEAGDDLVPLDPQQRRHCLQARRLVAMELARHPPLLRLYRARVDDRAKHWLDQGIADRDPVLLRRLVDRAFASRHTDRALELLGDLAFERGDFAEAEQWWRQLARPASRVKDPAQLGLVFPDPRTEIALLRAKLILSQIFRGERATALAELSVFRAVHGKAEGHLAGRSGNLVEILQEAARQAGRLTAPTGDRGWLTFGGAGSRTAIGPQAPRCRWLEQPWRVRLDSEGSAAAGPARTATQLAQSCIVHPVIAGDLVLTADDHSVTAHDLVTGRRRGRWELTEDRSIRWDAKTAGELGVRYTLTVAGNRLYVRLGTPVLPPVKNARGEAPKVAPSDSYLVCLALPPTADGKLVPCWQVKARTAEADGAFFEGSPLVHDDRAYIGRTHMTADGRATTGIDCYRVDTGDLRWRQEVCDAHEAGEGHSRYRYHLLTRAGPNIVYASQSGAIVMVDAVTGQRVWAIRYSRRGNRLADSTLSPRGLAPAIFADGRLYIAPADLDRILCLEAATGRTLWESDALEVSHLLGVAKGRLIFTTASAPAGIRAIDAVTGRNLRGWIQPSGDSNGLPTVGRGLLVGEWVFWPTANGLRILMQEDGEPAADAYLPLNNSIHGNLATSQGCLVVASDRELLGYVPESAHLVPRSKNAQANPGSAGNHFRLGLAQVSAGLVEPALREFEQAEKLAKSPELCRHALQERQSALVMLAEHHVRGGEWKQAAAMLNRAAAAEFPVALRIQALARLAELQARNRKPDDAVATWQAVLADPMLRAASWVGPDGVPHRAGTHAFRQIDHLIGAHGAGVYAKFEAQARALSIGEENPKAGQALGRLVHEFPNASFVPKVLWQLAAQRELLKLHVEAVRVYRRLLEWPHPCPERGRALAALARHYEQHRQPDAARATWKRLAREHGEQKIPLLDPARTVSEIVASELQRLSVEKVGEALPDLDLPLKETWQVRFPDEKMERLLASSLADRLYLTRADGALVCRDVHTGKEFWTAILASGGRKPPEESANRWRFPRGAYAPRSPLEDSKFTWVGSQADLAIAGGPHGIVAFADGVRPWAFDPAPELGSLGSFQLSGSRLMCLQGERRLWALDAETGTVLWSMWAPGASVGVSPPRGRFHSFAFAGPDQIVIQPSHGQAWVADAQTGRKLHDLTVRGEPWQQPPVVWGDRRVCLQPDSGHLVMFDVSTGKEVWRHTVERSVSLTGEPLQVAATQTSLLVILPRNQGYELIRLDAATGKDQWTDAIFLGVDRPELARGAWDSNAVYLPIAGVLRAVSLREGKRMWSRVLGSETSGWRVSVTRNFLLVCPREANSEMPFSTALRRYLPATPNALYPASASLFVGLPGILTEMVQEQAPSRLCLMVCDPRDGRVLQRLNYESRGRSVVVSLGERGAVVGLANTISGLR